MLHPFKHRGPKLVIAFVCLLVGAVAVGFVLGLFFNPCARTSKFTANVTITAPPYAYEEEWLEEETAEDEEPNEEDVYETVPLAVYDNLFHPSLIRPASFTPDERQIQVEQSRYLARIAAALEASLRLQQQGKCR